MSIVIDSLKLSRKILLICSVIALLIFVHPDAAAQSQTEIPADVSLLSVRFDPQQQAYLVDVVVPHPEVFTRIDLILWNQEGHEISRQALDQIIHNQTINITAPEFSPGQTYSLEVYGYGLDGALINSNSAGSALAQRDFVHVPNNAGVQLSRPLLTFNEDTNQLIITLDTNKSDAIFVYRTIIVDIASNTVVLNQLFEDLDNLPGSAKVAADVKDLPEGKFSIEIQALDTNSAPLASIDAQWENSRSAPTISPLVFNYIFETPELQVNFLLENGSSIDRYRMLLVDSQTNDVAVEHEITAEDAPPISIALDGVPAGEYRLSLDALSAEGGILTSVEGETSYQPPPPPGFLTRLSGGLLTNPFILLFIVFIILLVIFILFARWLWLKRSSGTPVLQAGGLQVPEFQSMALNQTILPDSKKDAPPVYDDSKPPPAITITINKYPDNSWQGKKINVTRYPFSIGRITSDLELGADTGISRRHAEIHISQGGVSIVDKRSSNGTFVNGERITPETPFQLSSSVINMIDLGRNTRLDLEF